MEKHPVPQFAVLTGKIKSGTWSKGFRFLPSNEEATSKGTLLVNLSLATLEKADLESLSQRLLTSIHEGYFQDSNSTITDSLKSSLTNAQNQLKTILPTIGVHTLTTEIQIGVVLNQFLYLAKSGEEPVYLKRGGNFTPIKFTHVASGRLEGGDWLILANQNFWQQVTTERLNGVITENFEATLKSIDQLVGDKENISCVLARFQIEEDLGEGEKVRLLDPSLVATSSWSRWGQALLVPWFFGSGS
jgi:serine/threonine protein phosphatase PrpC